MFFDIVDTALLTAADEIRLAVAIETGVTAERALMDGSLCCDVAAADLELIAELGRAARDEFFMGNLRMVANLALTWADRAGVSAEELFQEGCVGLGRAIQRWDWRRGYRFSSLAWPMVEAEISHAAMRRCGAIEASVFRLRSAFELRRAREQLETLLGHEVTVTELAGYLGRDVRTVAATVELSAPDRLSDDLMALLPDPAGECPPDELHAEVLRGLDELPPQEAALLRCSFGIGQPAMTRAATADRLGLSVSTTRRLELKALSRLRRLLLSAEAA